MFSIKNIKNFKQPRCHSSYKYWQTKS